MPIRKFAVGGDREEEGERGEVDRQREWEREDGDGVGGQDEFDASEFELRE